MTRPTHIAAICLLNMADGKIAPALTHILSEPGESRLELLGRAVESSRERFPGFMIFDLNVATVGEDDAAEPGGFVVEQIAQG
jgi:hypothetical protein